MGALVDAAARRSGWCRSRRVSTRLKAVSLSTAVHTENIVRCFRERLVMEGLALTLAWGVMARTAKYVYDRSKTYIAEALTNCLDDVEASRDAEGAWRILTRDLGWSNVMASKTLHFMARGL